MNARPRQAFGRPRRMAGIVQHVTERRAHEQRIARLTRMHATLSGINTMIVRAKSRAELFREACRVVVERGKFHFFHLWLADSERRTLNLAARGGTEHVPIRDIALDAEGAAGWSTSVECFLTNRVVILNDLKAEGNPSPLRKEMVESGCRAVASLPLRRDGNCFGVLSCPPTTRPTSRLRWSCACPLPAATAL